jgi:predicted nucleotidyltransferase component of viral defense system
MKRGEGRNVAASVHDRLLNQARATGTSLNDLLAYYAIERFLYRLSISRYAEQFILKGALMLRAREGAPMRPTRDIDLLGRTSNSTENLTAIIRACMEIETNDDGLRFDGASIRAATIARDAEYRGIRLIFLAFLGTARIPMQIDIGFGDIVVPSPVWIEYPELLGYGRPRLLMYTLESAIAEKFHAMVALDFANSRMKDFYDIHYLALHHTFDGETLMAAIRRTFDQRETIVTSDIPMALTSQFAEHQSKQAQWVAFLRKLRLSDSEPSLHIVVERLRDFLLEPLTSIADPGQFQKRWAPGGPWQSSLQV